MLKKSKKTTTLFFRFSAVELPRIRQIPAKSRYPTNYIPKTYKKSSRIPLYPESFAYFCLTNLFNIKSI